MLNLIVGVVFFGLLILFHELGHFTVAKLVGIKVMKFSIGFGRSIFKWTRGGTEYMISMVPLGGYVKLQGDDITQKADFVPGDFFYADWKKRSLLVLAGPVMNLVLAFILFSGFYFFAGISNLNENPVIGGLKPNFPAEIAGIQKGDRILKINSMEIKNWYQMAAYISKFPEKKINITLEREGKVLEKTLVPVRQKEDDTGKIGIMPETIVEKVGFFSAIQYGTKTGVLIIKGIFVGLKKVIFGEEKAGFVGPIGIFQISYETIKTGYSDFIFLVGFLSISIGVLNLFPIPLLDGGYIILNFIEAVRRKRPTEQTMKVLNIIGLSILLLIFISASVSDIQRLFTGQKLGQ